MSDDDNARKVAERDRFRRLLRANGAPEYAFGGELSRLSPDEEAAVRREAVKKRAASLPPNIGRAPTDREETEIRAIEVELNRARYMLERTTGSEQRSWISIRKAKNAELIEYTKTRGIWRPPLHSVAEVLDGKF